MFKLTRDKYIAALESAEELEKTLQKELENLGISSKNLSGNWQGTQAERSLAAINASLEAGNHAKALAYTQGMISVMGEYLPEIEKLMAKREQIGRQLEQDEYVEPDLTSFCENELIINYDYIDDIKADVEGALLRGDAAIEILEEMIEEAEECAGEYINLTHVRELLEEGKKKLHRLENYRDEFVDFGKKMSDMEYNMSMDLANVMRELGDETSLSGSTKKLMIDQNMSIEKVKMSETNSDNSNFVLMILQGIMKYIKKLSKYMREINEHAKEQNYNLLSEELKQYVTIDDMIFSDDGFIMLTKSLADIMEEMGITDTNTSETNKNDVQSYYDDWYIYGIKDEAGNITYSLVKMREKENDSEIGDADGDDPEVAISFIEFDIKKLTSLRVEQTEEKIDELTNEINRVVKEENQRHNTVLQNYFSKTESKAPYIVADAYIKMLASTAKNNLLELPNGFEKAPERLIDALKRINEEAGHIIYDEENKCINIEDTDNLSEGEKYAILTVYTSNVTYNSFAAEVEFHSDALVAWKAKIPYLGKKKWYESAIRANMGFNEEQESNSGGGFDEYYDLDSKIVRMQAEIHGEK